MPHILFQDKKIFYSIEGKGKPVLLLHGFGEDSHIWNKQVEVLKENYCVIIPDLPGSGQSELLDGNRALNDYAEAVKAIVDEIIYQPFGEESIGKLDVWSFDAEKWDNARIRIGDLINEHNN